MNKISSVLITGGTGSFGQAFIKHLLATTHIPRIVVYSRGEHAQANLRMALGDPSRVRWMIGDVRDVDRLKRAMRGVDTVIHAAALKRIEVGAYNPDEMVKTNVIGVMNVIEAAVAMNVKRVIGLSSDKAFQPISPYGQSKALGESLLLAANSMYGEHGPKFACTRYGNVWAAQGSVVPQWQAQIANGATELRMTDPNCTRFFMHMHEAVAMVDDLMLHMQGGELVIPHFLPAYRLADLAKAFRFLYNVTFYADGLPSHEKLHESMNDFLCSSVARRMTVEELVEHLRDA